MGIDPSIRSTGICVIENEDIGVARYYLVTSSVTKKFIKNARNLISIIQYEHVAPASPSARDKELAKTHNVISAATLIRRIIETEHPDVIVLEAVAFAANGTIDQLAGLNYIIRQDILETGCKLVVVSPSVIKKNAIGNGAAGKEDMIRAWVVVQPQFAALSNQKIDDLADAYFMACYSEI